MGDDEKEYAIKVTWLEGYKFEIDFGLDAAVKVFVDEDPPQGRNEGPDPSRMLAASIVHCTLSSLIFCIEKSRGRINSLNGEAFIRFGRDENGRLRINEIRIAGYVSVPEEDKAKLNRCLPIFQKYCTVTESVKKGISVSTEINVV